MKPPKKYKKSKPTAKQVKESVVTYKTKKEVKLTMYNSFEEAEEDHYKWLASLTPEQHLKNAVKLIKRVYAEDLKKNVKLEKKLIIVQ